jgi:hypothetical protein
MEMNHFWERKSTDDDDGPNHLGRMITEYRAQISSNSLQPPQKCMKYALCIMGFHLF